MKTTTSSIPSPRIYVACLAAYNAGTLHGRWINAYQDADAIQQDVLAILADSPEHNAEEWAIHDHEGFGKVHISQSEDLSTVSQLASFIEEHGHTGLALLSYHSGDLQEAQQSLENYMGTYPSLADYAEETMEGVEIPKSVAPYIDYERMAHDMEINGDVFTIEISYNEVMVFLNR